MRLTFVDRVLILAEAMEAPDSKPVQCNVTCYLEINIQSRSLHMGYPSYLIYYMIHIEYLKGAIMYI